MEELVEYINRVPKRKRAVFWKSVDLRKFLPSPLKEVAHLSSWRSCYSNQDIQSCISKIKPAAFSENLVSDASFCIWLKVSHFKLVETLNW